MIHIECLVEKRKSRMLAMRFITGSTQAVPGERIT
jgi:hypothetical protein